LRFKIDCASLKVGRKFTFFALFYFVFEGNFPSTSPRGVYIWRGDLTEGFLCYRFEGLTHGGAYFRNFTVYPYCILITSPRNYTLWKKSATAEVIGMQLKLSTAARGGGWVAKIDRAVVKEYRSLK